MANNNHINGVGSAGAFGQNIKDLSTRSLRSIRISYQELSEEDKETIALLREEIKKVERERKKAMVGKYLTDIEQASLQGVIEEEGNVCMEDNMKKITMLDFLLEDRIKSLSPDMVEPDYRGTKEKRSFFPWEHVDICMDETIEVIPNRLPCPVCGKPSSELHWIHFESPQYTWENLYGREGAMSICTDCHCQVEFICVLMN